MERGKRKVKEGIVVKDKMDKTRVVEVTRTYRHPLYSKVLKRRSKYYVHDDKNESHVGDKVEIMETRPLSLLKRWRVIKITQKA